MVAIRDTSRSGGARAAVSQSIRTRRPSTDMRLAGCGSPWVMTGSARAGAVSVGQAVEARGELGEVRGAGQPAGGARLPRTARRPTGGRGRAGRRPGRPGLAKRGTWRGRAAPDGGSGTGAARRSCPVTGSRRQRHWAYGPNGDRSGGRPGNGKTRRPRTGSSSAAQQLRPWRAGSGAATNSSPAARSRSRGGGAQGPAEARSRTALPRVTQPVLVVQVVDGDEAGLAVLSAGSPSSGGCPRPPGT